MNKQNRNGMKNAPVPDVTLPKPPGSTECPTPAPKQLQHPFKKGACKA